jgi:hypothetical protein
MNIGELAKFRGGVSVDTISEATSGSGVTIDSVLLKDGNVTASASGTVTTTYIQAADAQGLSFKENGGTEVMSINDSGMVSYPKGLALTGSLVTIDADNKSVANTNRADFGVAGTINGLSGGVNGQLLTLNGNSPTSSITLTHVNGSGTQKFILPGGTNLTLSGGYGGAVLYFNGTYWIVVAKT